MREPIDHLIVNHSATVNTQCRDPFARCRSMSSSIQPIIHGERRLYPKEVVTFSIVLEIKQE